MESPRIERILCPVDFSELSAAGLRYAAALALCSGARLTVLYADTFEPPLYFTQSRLDELEQQFRDARQEAAITLRRFVDRTLANASTIETEVVVADALPADAILKAAGETGVGLIVMGTHGRSGVNRLLLGSVTERVLRATRVPVLAVRGDVEPGQIRRVLCPVNESPEARAALRLAARLASCVGASLTVLHVTGEGAGARAADVCSWLAGDRPPCEIEELEREGELAAQVLEAARKLPADMIVLGSAHQLFSDASVLGTSTVRILRHAPCPVLTVFEGRSE